MTFISVSYTLNSLLEIKYSTGIQFSTSLLYIKKYTWLPPCYGTFLQTMLDLINLVKKLNKLQTSPEHKSEYYIVFCSNDQRSSLFSLTLSLRKAKIVYNFGLSECNRVKDILY